MFSPTGAPKLLVDVVEQIGVAVHVVEGLGAQHQRVLIVAHHIQKLCAQGAQCTEQVKAVLQREAAGLHGGSSIPV